MAMLTITFTALPAGAHEDQIAPLAKVEKTYAAPRPLGTLTATWMAKQSGENPSLVVACDLFRVNVPVKGLVDLPRPDWGNFTVAYSLTSYEAGKWVERPYVYLSVLLHGPAGQTWRQTWATFHFDADGKLVRQIKRFIPDEATNSISVVWKEWPIGKGVSATTVLESAKDD